MQRIWQIVFVLFSLLLSGTTITYAQTPIPELTAPVMDTANMMQLDRRDALNQHLLNYAQKSGSQIVVLTVPSIVPESAFDYSARVMKEWQIGRENINDGVLLLIVRDDKVTFLAPGRGLEGAIPDAYAKRILDDVLRPYLQQGQIDNGIAQTVLQIEKLIAGEGLPQVAVKNDSGDWLSRLMMIFFIALFVGSVLKNILGRFLGGFASGGLVCALGLFLGWGLPLALLGGFLASIAALAVGNNAFVGGNDGFGGWGGPRGGGFGDGGGGFGGGGGGYGGGGASGGW